MNKNNIAEALQQVSSEQIREHITALEGVRHPVTNPEVLEAGGDYIRKTLETLGYEMSEHVFFDDDEQFRNIIGTHEGTQYPEEYVLVLAHYDSEIDTPGANDNASGVAAMLEVARVLRPLRFARSTRRRSTLPTAIRRRSSFRASLARRTRSSYPT